MNDPASASVMTQPAPVLASAGSVWSKGWPSLCMAALVLAAALYSFAPRPMPSFPLTEARADRVLINGVVRAGDRFVAVGEQGLILRAGAAEGPWTAVALPTNRGSTLTQIAAVDDGVLIAVGHDGWILRSDDGGAHWVEAAFAAGSDPLLGLAGPFGPRLYAYGAFGKLEVSEDHGMTWQATSLDVQLPDVDASDAVPTDDDPFAMGSMAMNDYADRHLNGLIQTRAGTLLMVGERGLILRSSDGGQRWTPVDDVYAGSFFGAVQLASGTLVVYGMRGHAFRSEDDGLSWQESQVPVTQSLFDGVALPDGRVLLVGASNALLASDDDGRNFSVVAPASRNALTSLVPLDSAHWLTAGEGGLRLQSTDGEVE